MTYTTRPEAVLVHTDKLRRDIAKDRAADSPVANQITVVVIHGWTSRPETRAICY